MIKNLVGIAPQPDENGGFFPSKLSLRFATSKVTDYEDGEYIGGQKIPRRKILMVCTEERYMTMATGKRFSTGNHPVEMLVPMLHFKNAGFDIDVFTPTGDSVKIEMWVMPSRDSNVQRIFAEYRERFEKPYSLAEFVSNSMKDSKDYMAVFIPGGHGAMLGLPDNHDLGKPKSCP